MHAAPGSLRSSTSEVFEAYKQLWRVVKLPAVLQLSVLLLSYRIAVLPAEGVARCRGVGSWPLGSRLLLSPQYSAQNIRPLVELRTAWDFCTVFLSISRPAARPNTR